MGCVKRSGDNGKEQVEDLCEDKGRGRRNGAAWSDGVRMGVSRCRKKAKGMVGVSGCDM